MSSKAHNEGRTLAVLTIIGKVRKEREEMRSRKKEWLAFVVFVEPYIIYGLNLIYDSDMVTLTATSRV